MSPKVELPETLLRNFSLKELLEGKLQGVIEALAAGEGGNDLYYQVVHEVEESLIRLALEATGYNQLRAAKILGINRNTLRKKAKQLGLEP